MAVTERLLLRTVYDGVRKILPGEFPPGSGLGFGELTRERIDQGDLAGEN